MIRRPSLSLHRLVLSLSDALDCIRPEISEHQQRVTYIALNLGKIMGLEKNELTELFLASALHDIGMIREEEKVRILVDGDRDQVERHGRIGSLLLEENRFFRNVAPIVRYHHRPWDYGAGALCDGKTIPIASQIIHLADAVERGIDRSRNVVAQARSLIDEINAREGSQFHPDCVQAFNEAARPESFWLDCVFERIYSLLLQTVDEVFVDATDQIIQDLAEIFARVVDSMSPWTANHSAGVAAAAHALAAKMGFSCRECTWMRTAGLLHDLGKLSIPSSILDKPGRLTREEAALVRGHTYFTFRILDTVGFPREITEWASFHHERLNGSGYPFRHRAEDLTLGARIMAVADIFTALLESRPYHDSIPRPRIAAILERMAGSESLDRYVVDVLLDHLDEVDQACRREQERYAERQQILAACLGRSWEPAPCSVQKT